VKGYWNERNFAVILGMSVATFTIAHVVLSLIGIVAGLIVLFGMFKSYKMQGLTALFLATTVLTSLTGFMFGTPLSSPANVFGILSMVVLVIAIAALYGFGLAGAWRWIYVVTAIIALYLNCFVLVVQAFQKLSFLRPLAPTQAEPPFAIVQGVVLVLFIVFGYIAVRGFHPVMKSGD
jgi:hypothetical protein